MNLTIALATAGRVLGQLRHDRRTVALLVLVPALLMVLLRYVFDSEDKFSALAPALLGIFPFLLMFLTTSVTTLRERTSGTLERLMTTPLGKLDLLAGYALAFGAVAVISVAVSVGVSFRLGFSLAGSAWALLLVTLVDAMLGIGLGLFASAFSATEFQALQMMPLIVLPQVLLCGLFQPRSDMAKPLQWLSDVMPVSYAVQALQEVGGNSGVTNLYLRDLAIVAGVGAFSLVLAAATLRRSTP